MRSVTKSHYNLRERGRKKKTSYQWTTGSDHHHQRGVSAWRKKLQDKEEGRRGERQNCPRSSACACVRFRERREQKSAGKGTQRERRERRQDGGRTEEKRVKIKAKEQHNAEKESTAKRKRHAQKFLFFLGRNYSHTEIRCFAAQLLGKARPREQRTQSDVKKEKGGKKAESRKQSKRN